MDSHESLEEIVSSLDLDKCGFLEPLLRCPPSLDREMNSVFQGQDCQESSFNGGRLSFDGSQAKLFEKPKLPTVLEEACTQEALKQEASGKDAKDAVLPQMCWGMVQDQLGTMLREIDGLRTANSQVQSRLTEVLVQRADARTELNREVSELLSQITDGVGSESKKRIELEQEFSNLRFQLNASLGETSRIVQEAQQKQGEQIRQLLTAIGNDIRSETDNRIAADKQICLELTGVRQACETEVRDRISRDDFLSEVEKKMSIALDNEHQARKDSHIRIQCQLDALSNSLSVEKDAWVQHRTRLISEVDNKLSTCISALEKDQQNRTSCIPSLQSQVDSLSTELSQFDLKRKDWYAEMSQYADRKVEVVNVKLDDARNQLQLVLENSKRDTVSIANLRSEIDALRGAISKISAESASYQQSSCGDLVNLQAQSQSALSEIKVLSEVCEKSKCDQAKQFQELCATMQEQISQEGQKREQLSLEIHQKMQTGIVKVDNDRIEVASLRDRVDLNSESYNHKISEVESHLAASIDAMKHMIIEERASRENAQKRLEGSLKEDIKTMAEGTCPKDPDQKMILHHCKQILMSDEEIRQKLKSALSTEMITKELFTEEINRLWRRMGSESVTSTCVMQQTSSVISCAGLDARSLTPAPQRGSSPLAPSHAVTAQSRKTNTASSGTLTPRAPRLVPVPVYGGIQQSPR